MEGGFLAGAPGRSECSRDFFLCRGRRSILPQHLLHDLLDHGGFYRWRWGRRGRALPAVGQHRTGQKDGSAPPRWSRPWRCRRSCPKAGGKMGKRNPRGKPLGFWRSIRDLNSGGAVNALSHFESREPLANRCRRRSEQAGSSPIFRGGQPYFGRNAKISSMVRIVLKRPVLPRFCTNFWKNARWDAR